MYINSKSMSIYGYIDFNKGNRKIIVKLITRVQVSFGAAVLFGASTVSALPFITGELGMGGNYLSVDENWGAVSLGYATGIDFDPNLFIVNGATGSFSGIASSIGTIEDFQFDPGLGIRDGFGGVTSVSTIANFWAIDNFSFELTSVTKLSSSTSTFLDLQGTGVIRSTGFEDTLGSWIFTGENNGGTFTWSAGTTQTVPEPALIALIGVGLMGIVVSRRRIK